MQHILKYFPEITDDQKARFEALQSLYEAWNAKINVVSRKDIGHLYTRHVLHSLAIARYIDFEAGSEIMDAGTGGGFPGIPLAVMFPEVTFTLVDSVGKKIRVVEDIASSLELKNVEAIHERIEKVRRSFDFVVSRAVKSLPLFYTWVGNKIRKQAFNVRSNGIIYLKGGDFKNELEKLPLKSKIISLSEYFEEDFFVTKKLVHLYR
ncbi:MAG: 16S rRNA (guanine(527)-N(7))-methyltransferase RsmG [Bacteroidales bacterium]|nr:16S rRNA (guanine(527)-N(7))-methyltransferase RsmG [Bacteroidales bacterium]MCF8388796.1 16S rRNA (guanine(527)-N(7))-methyltransferase RsmG [Bacteroidales bacterium]